MNISAHFSAALRTLLSSRMRSTLSSLGIVIGVFSVTVLLAFGEGARQDILKSVSSMGTNLLTVSPGGSAASRIGGTTGGRSSRDVLTVADADLIATLTGVAAVSPEVSGTRQAVAGSKNTSVSVIGVTPSYAVVRSVKTQAGLFISAADVSTANKVAVLGADAAVELFGSGADPLGQDIRLGASIVTVVGVLERKGQQLRGGVDNAVLVPLTVAQGRILGNKFLGSIAVQADSAESVDGALTAIKAALVQKFRFASYETANFTVSNQADLLSSITDITGTLKIFLGGVAAISLLVGGIGIMNIMLVSVTERIREIGIRKAVGARYRDLILQFLAESVVLSAFGGAIGLAASFLGIWALTLFGLSAVVTWSSVALAVACSVGTGIVFGVLPARKAALLDPIECLRHE